VKCEDVKSVGPPKVSLSDAGVVNRCCTLSALGGNGGDQAPLTAKNVGTFLRRQGFVKQV
jgi:hypothetical protein